MNISINSESVLLKHPAENESELLHSTGRWASFLAWIYLIAGFFLLAAMVLVIFNLDWIAHKLLLAVMKGKRDTALQFILGSGKWIFAGITSISAGVCMANGVLLYRFASKSRSENATGSLTFLYLGQYLKFTAVLSVISTVLTLSALLFYFFS
ncbi:MAG TPA: hypothetical protein PLP34_00180 [Chitinophagaceae bacterium]|nr:hypothetical protein [Chitinophagaceae bacterium]HNF70796.1 hypothetical protein [Chitinophagaceae bacterium]